MIRPLTMTISALGGQGGGVVADWFVDVARRENYIAQATSVPGVAQRTGATVYYLEFFPRNALPPGGGKPVLALMPQPGDVDVAIAAELLEAGRALQRGIVTPDRTTLIASSHRVYAIDEKIHLGDGRADAGQVLEMTKQQARRCIIFDMQTLAEANGSVISAVLFGAAAGSGALPFAKDSYREAIKASGIAVKESLAAFEAGAAAASAESAATPAASSTSQPSVPPGLAIRIATTLPVTAQAAALNGVARLIDYQDEAHATLYLDRLAALATHHKSADAVMEAVARGLALWMSFEDTIRVADLKIRASRRRRVLEEVRAQKGQLVYVTEFMKPRVREICGTLPEGLGRRVLASGFLTRLIERLTGGKQIATSRISGFLLLYFLASLRPWRRRTLRYAEETVHQLEWLALVQSLAATDPALALEVAECQQLVKGYGETHERGLANYQLIADHARSWVGRPEAAYNVRDLRKAALADDQGIALGAALKKILAST